MWQNTLQRQRRRRRKVRASPARVNSSSVLGSILASTYICWVSTYMLGSILASTSTGTRMSFLLCQHLLLTFPKQASRADSFADQFCAYLLTGATPTYANKSTTKNISCQFPTKFLIGPIILSERMFHQAAFQK